MDEQPVAVEEIAEKAETYLHDTSLTPEEYESLDLDELDTEVDSENPYSAMQTGIFEMLDDAGRLCRWASEDDLVTCVENLPEE